MAKSFLYDASFIWKHNILFLKKCSPGILEM